MPAGAEFVVAQVVDQDDEEVGFLLHAAFTDNTHGPPTNIIIYIVAGGIGLYLSLLGFFFALISGPLFAFVLGALLLAAHISSILYVRKKAMEGKGRLAALTLVAPIFVVGGAALLIGWGMQAVEFLKPDASAFKSECRTAGAQFHQLPSSPVHSIAYDWDGAQAPRVITHFTLGCGGHADSMGFSDGYFDSFPYPPAIEFTERKRRPDSIGPAAGAPGPYVRLPRRDGRFPRQDTSHGIEALTADVLVTYRCVSTEDLKQATPQQGIVTHDLTVTDRRNGEELASLRYVIDQKKNRACGTTAGTTMNERAFVLKAAGLQ